MKVCKKVILSILVVSCILFYGVNVKAATPLEISIKEDVINLEQDNNNFEFNIEISDKDFIATGFGGILEWDSEVIAIDKILSVDGSRWNVTGNKELGDVVAVLVDDTQIEGKDPVINVKGHVLKDGDINTTIKLTNVTYSDRDDQDNNYTDKEIAVQVRRTIIEITPTPDLKDPVEDPTPSLTPGDDGPGDDNPGDDTPGDDEPGDDNPGDDTPGDDEPGDDNPGDKKPTPTPSPTPDKTVIPSDKTPQAGTGKTIAVVMGIGLVGTTVFYIKFSKNNY